MSNMRIIEVAQEHKLYDTLQQLENDEDPTEDDLVFHNYRINTPISTIRCFWQHMVSSIAGADLVNIKVMYQRVNEFGDEVVQDRHRDGRFVTIEDLATFSFPNCRNDPSFELCLTFEYVRNDFEIFIRPGQS